jgi:CBS domain containing-hemolysin-like protein
MCSNPFLSLSLLYRETLNDIMTKGHSRVPVYAGNSKNVIGLILVIPFLSVSVIQLM